MTNSSQTKTSNSVKFPRPKRATITSPVAEKGILEEGGSVVLSVAADNEGRGTLSYQWEMDPNHAANFGGQETAFEPIIGAETASYEVTQPGHYRVVITNTRNKETIDVISTNARVTNAPEVPVLDYTVNESRFFNYIQLLEGDVIPKVRIAEPVVEHDEFTAAWYEVKSDADGNEKSYEIVKDKVVEKDVNGDYVATFNPLDYPEYFDGELVDGAYYCVITNKLNGETVDTMLTSFSERFYINEYELEEVEG